MAYFNPNANTVGSVTVYGKPGCKPCEGTVRTLETENIRFHYRDVTEDDDAAEEVRKLGYTGVPVVVVYNPNDAIAEHWHGYRPDRIKALAE